MLMLLAAVAGALLLQAAKQACRGGFDSPVKIERGGVHDEDAPPTVLYKATNQTDADLDQFTVIAYVFDDKGTRRRQTAPGRRAQAKTTKFDHRAGWIAVAPTDQLSLGVNQAQKVNSSLVAR